MNTAAVIGRPVTGFHAHTSAINVDRVAFIWPKVREVTHRPTKNPTRDTFINHEQITDVGVKKDNNLAFLIMHFYEIIDNANYSADY